MRWCSQDAGDEANVRKSAICLLLLYLFVFTHFLLDAQRSEARHLLWASLSVCPSDCLSVRHTGEWRLNGLRYRNMHSTVR